MSQSNQNSEEQRLRVYIIFLISHKSKNF